MRPVFYRGGTWQERSQNPLEKPKPLWEPGLKGILFFFGHGPKGKNSNPLQLELDDLCSSGLCKSL